MEPVNDYTEEDTLFDPDLVVMVEVEGGVASFTKLPEHNVDGVVRKFDAIIVDYDNFPDAEIDWENGVIRWGEPG